MNYLHQNTLVLTDDTIVDKSYSEDIIVGKGITLTIEGYVNRLIVVTGGTVIVKGTCNRINCISGKVHIEKKGFVHSLYAIHDCDFTVYGSVYEIITRDGNKCVLNEGSVCKTILNNDSEFTIHDNVVVDTYIQIGENAKIYMDSLCSISNFQEKKCLFY